MATKKTKPTEPKTWEGYKPPPPGAGEGYAAASEFRGRFIESQEDILERWRQLKTPEAMAVFAERWVSLTANQYERTWPVLYQMLKFIEQHQIYKDETKTSDRKTHESFEAYFEAKVRQQFAVWSDWEVDYHFAVDHCPELLKRPFSEAHQEIKTKQERASEKQRDQYGRFISTPSTSYKVTCGERGNSAAYLKNRLTRDHPEILAQWNAGEYQSLRAAGLAAGIVKEDTPPQIVRAAWKKATLDDKLAIIDFVQDQLQSDPTLLDRLS